jgi:hypothetical protein
VIPARTIKENHKLFIGNLGGKGELSMELNSWDSMKKALLCVEK